MFFTQLPAELICHIIDSVVQGNDPSQYIRIREANPMKNVLLCGVLHCKTLAGTGQRDVILYLIVSIRGQQSRLEELALQAEERDRTRNSQIVGFVREDIDTHRLDDFGRMTTSQDVKAILIWAAEYSEFELLSDLNNTFHELLLPDFVPPRSYLRLMFRCAVKSKHHFLVQEIIAKTASECPPGLDRLWHFEEHFDTAVKAGDTNLCARLLDLDGVEDYIGGLSSEDYRNFKVLRGAIDLVAYTVSMGWDLMCKDPTQLRIFAILAAIRRGDVKMVKYLL
ncbi:hypothetical protein BU23DRAFT_565733 [Bimuria novae-zelandiae CBS 107.79]|uniref:Ankyrin repeat protein n=1 Tax=Bimuria novae-zelandiae CBS 107.79 TaxID=1447943 RepID=A0A6A5VJH7_9PLEO|nr:hypothetical protein BU23DRAFT_565733 [Bimuria novae-zelandiae CBS 107.79]